MDRKPSDFNWVEERTACEPVDAFNRLMKGAELNVEQRNKDVMNPGDWRFVFRDRSTEAAYPAFTIFDRGADVRRAVDFRLTQDGVAVRVQVDEPIKDLIFKPKLTEHGDCRFIGEDGKAFDTWEVLRLVLEGLLFPSWRSGLIRD